VYPTKNKKVFNFVRKWEIINYLKYNLKKHGVRKMIF
jgi:hypothetical protein